MSNPFAVVEQFENAIAAYCGAPFAVACTSCTTAIQMGLAWFKSKGHAGFVQMPRYSYVGVPMSIKNAGFKVVFTDEGWSGEYQFRPLPLWDSARRTTSGMYRPGQIQCLSLHWSKILGVQQGGVLLTDDPAAHEWLKRYGFDGRTRGVPVRQDKFDMVGIHAYLSPEVAAAALVRLALLKPHNPDLPWDDYPDLSTMEIFYD